jgi:GST-like protein
MTTEIELHGARTGNCLRAAVTFEEAGLPYTPVRLDLRHGAHGASDYLSLNPAGKVPTVVDRRGAGEPFVLTQSNAIMLWVADQRPGLLLSVDDPAQRATTLERYFYFITDVIERSRAAFQVRRSGDNAGSAYLDQVALEAAVFSEIFLKDSEFMAGDRFSIADIAGSTILSFLEPRIDWSRCLRLRHWLDTVAARPAVRRGMHAFDAVDSNSNDDRR